MHSSVFLIFTDQDREVWENASKRGKSLEDPGLRKKHHFLYYLEILRFT